MQVIFREHGYIVDGGELTFADLYNLAFDSALPEDSGAAYLIQIAKSLVDSCRYDPDIELTRIVAVPDTADFYPLMKSLPFVLGAEFVNLNWILDIYNSLAEVLNAELAAWGGTAEEWLL